MRITRPALALALTASFLATGVASAAKKPAAKPTCNIVVDDAGDASITGADPSDGTLDILGADVASDAKTFTAVLRLKDLSASSFAQTGRNYYVQITTATTQNPVYFSYETDPTGATFNWGALVPGAGASTYTPSGKATGVVDKAKNEIRISVPVADLSALANLKPGNKVLTVHANSTAAFVVLVTDVDTADSSKVYVTGAKSCVKPGK